MTHVMVMAKEPVAGRVKTRLCPPCSPAEACRVAEAALADTLDAVAASSAGRRILALDGRPGPWLPPGFEIVPQRGRGLAERLTNAWRDTRGPGIQIGMDTPQVTGGVLDDLLAQVRPGRAVLGHATDGGWWVIGLDSVDPARVFARVPMSTPATGRVQERRLRELGMLIAPAPELRDIDTAADLMAVSAGAPHLRTAAVAATLCLGVRVDAVVA